MSTQDALADEASTDPATAISRAAESGDSLEMLRALRLRLAKAVDNEHTSPRDLAALSRRLVDIDRDVKAAEAAQEGEGGEGKGAGGGDVHDEEFDPSAV